MTKSEQKQAELAELRRATHARAEPVTDLRNGARSYRASSSDVAAALGWAVGKVVALWRHHAAALGGTYRAARHKRGDKRAFNVDDRHSAWLEAVFTLAGDPDAAQDQPAAERPAPLPATRPVTHPWQVIARQTYYQFIAELGPATGHVNGVPTNASVRVVFFAQADGHYWSRAGGGAAGRVKDRRGPFPSLAAADAAAAAFFGALAVGDGQPACAPARKPRPLSDAAAYYLETVCNNGAAYHYVCRKSNGDTVVGPHPTADAALTAFWSWWVQTCGCEPRGGVWAS